MYYLEQKQFKPAMILLGIPFIGAEINMILSHPEVIQATHSLFSRKK